MESYDSRSPRCVLALIATIAFCILLRVQLSPLSAGAASTRPRFIRPADIIQPPLNHYNVVDWNMCGGFSTCGSNMDSPWQNLYNAVHYATQPSYAATVQEICKPQFDALNAYLGPLGFTGAKRTSSTPNSPCQYHGDAVFWSFGNGGTVSNSFTANTESYENRGYICGQATAPTAYFACTAHMASNNDDTAIKQANEYLGLIYQKNAAGLKTYGGGDFNLTPGQVPGYNGWSVNFLLSSLSLTSVDNSTRTVDTRNPPGYNSKIDFVVIAPWNHWAINNPTPATFEDYIRSNDFISDHRLVRAYIDQSG
jgi:hypothetical protein